jgi:hypothetical protein
MRQRRQVAGRADGPLRRHDRVDAEAQQIADSVDDDRPAAGVAEGQGVGPQQQHRPDDVPRQRLADAHGVRDEQVLLSRAESAGSMKVVARSPKPVVTP